jgi:hypothetical protein
VPTLNIYIDKVLRNFETINSILRYNSKVFGVCFLIILSSLAYSSPEKPDSLKKPSNNYYYDKNKELIKRIEKLETELYTREEFQKVSDKLIKIDYVEKNISARFDDLYKLAGTIVTLLLFIAGFTSFRAKRAAEETAKKEFDDKFKENINKITKVESDAQQLLNSIKGHLEAARKLTNKNRQALIDKFIKDIGGADDDDVKPDTKPKKNGGNGNKKK